MRPCWRVFPRSYLLLGALTLFALEFASLSTLRLIGPLAIVQPLANPQQTPEICRTPKVRMGYLCSPFRRVSAKSTASL
jgi:hypothetical protein